VPGGVAIILAIVLGAAVGGVTNGFFIGKMKLSFFVVTLGTLTVFTGVVNLWANTKSFYITAPIVSRIGVEDTLGIPTPILIMAVSFAVALYVQTRTYFGRDVYAVGGSLPAARLSGIRTSRTLVAVYAITGACAALGGIIAAGRIGAATPQVDNTLALQAAAAVLLGGTSLFGGAGGVGGTALGVLFIGILQNGLSIAGIQSFWQQVVTGVILIAAVMGDRISFKDLRRRTPAAAVDPEAPAATVQHNGEASAV
jgi:ribose transport system permease protein